MSPKTILLIHSVSPNTGKSFLSKLLYNKYKNSSIKSFSSPVIDYVTLWLETHSKFKSNNFKQLYIRANKETPLKYSYPDIDFEGSMRDFIAYLSLKYKEDSKDTKVFTKKSIEQIKETDKDIIIFDDLRLEQEYSLIKEAFPDSKIITIKINREKKKAFNKTPTLSSKFENQLKDFTFDIDFKYKNNYSNTQELLDLIMDRIDG